MFERKDWLVYSREHNAFWRPNASGYTNFIESAGRYTKDKAAMYCRPRDFAGKDNPPEVAVGAPEAIEAIPALRGALEQILRASVRSNRAGASLDNIAETARSALALLDDSDELGLDEIASGKVGY